jgi:hypothetical protein
MSGEDQFSGPAVVEKGIHNVVGENSAEPKALDIMQVAPAFDPGF